MNCPQAAHNLSNRNHSVLCLFVDIYKCHEKLVHSIPEDTEGHGIVCGDSQWWFQKGKTFWAHLWANKGIRMYSVLCCFSRVWLFATPWTVAHQAPLSMGFSRQEYWIGMPCTSPGDLPSWFRDWTCIAGRLFTIWATREAPGIY